MILKGKIDSLCAVKNIFQSLADFGLSMYIKIISPKIIISAVMSFFDPKLPIKLWKNNRIESLLLIATFCVTLFMGMVEGIVLGILLSFVHIIYKRKR